MLRLILALTVSWFPGSPGIPANFSMLYNGQNGSGSVSLGLARSTDGGETWTRYGAAPVMVPGSGWYDEQVHAPTIAWDGTQYVLFYGGFDGTSYRIGRAISTDLIAWYQDTANPIIDLGTSGDFDDAGLNFPMVIYDSTLSPAWRLWYTGFKSGGKTSVGYADSTDGMTWTKRGQMIAAGTSGQFDDEGTVSAAVVLVSGTYYVFYSGQGATGGSSSDYRTGYATATNPASSGTYTKQGVISAFSGNITSLTDGLTYRSNQLRSIVRQGSGWVGYGSAFQPVSPATQHEVSWRSTSTDLVTWTTPTGELLPLASGVWDTISAENPYVIESP